MNNDWSYTEFFDMFDYPEVMLDDTRAVFNREYHANNILTGNEPNTPIFDRLAIEKGFYRGN